jgi:hypothetical protein
MKQSPQRLKALREHALIESAISSNRIEGVTVDQSRVKAVVLGKSILRDRDEEEVRAIVMQRPLLRNSRRKFLKAGIQGKHDPWPLVNYLLSLFLNMLIASSKNVWDSCHRLEVRKQK